MTTEPPVSLRKPEEQAPEASAWITVPARFIALVIVLPVRLGYDLVLLLGRGLMAVLRGAWRTPGALWRLLVALARWVWDTLVIPVGRGFAWLGRGVWAGVRWVASGVAWFVDHAFLRPVRWFGRVVLAPIGRLLGAGAAAVWAGILWVGSGVAWLFRLLVVKPLDLLFTGIGIVLYWLWTGITWFSRTVWSGIAWVSRAVWSGVVRLGRGLWSVAVWLGRGLLAAFMLVIARPSALLWGHVLKPVLLGAVWLIQTTVGGVIAALGWAFHAVGVLLRLLFRLLVLVPANFVWQYALRPVYLAVAWAWRWIGRGLRWLAEIFIVTPFRAARHASRWTARVFVVEPYQWVRRSVLRPVREAVRQARRTAWQTVAQTGREVRGQLRGAFRR